MNPIDLPVPQADSVISEVRRVKTALAAKRNFDMVEMVRSPQERERKQKNDQGSAPVPTSSQE